MSYGTSGTVTEGGTAQDITTEGHGFFGVIFQNESDTEMRVSVDETATDETGTVVAAGASAYFGNLIGRRMSLFCATTGKAFSFRQATGEANVWGNLGGDLADQTDLQDALDDIDEAIALKYDAPTELPELPFAVDAQDIADALVTLGLVTQAEE